jgi:predicted RNA-binding protein YlxR (DUF448 family)
MKLPIILGIAAALSLVSCQNNDSKTDVNKVEQTELAKKGNQKEVTMLGKMMEKALTVEPSNERKAKRVYILMKESPLDMDTKKKIFKKALDKSGLEIKDQKEIEAILGKDI